MEHPGKELDKKLELNNMSRKELALRTGVSEKHICTVINGERGISASFARKLAYAFGGEMMYWVGLQAKYDEDQMRTKEMNNITPDETAILKPLREITSYLVSCKYLDNDCGEAEKVMRLRKFLNVSNLTVIPHIAYNAAYRAQLASNIKVDPYILFAWQRLCEKETENIDTADHLDTALLKLRLSDIKAKMFSNVNDLVKELQQIFSACGIAFNVVKNFRGAPVQGFIKKMPDDKIVLCLTIRGQRADTFWFTLFHEIAHILNGDYSARFVDFDSVQGDAEQKADAFAGETLIDSSQYREFILSGDTASWSAIEEFASKNSIPPFIVLGRLQKDGILDWSDFSHKVARYKWA